jgi:hypothetical protein
MLNEKATRQDGGRILTLALALIWKTPRGRKRVNPLLAEH